MPGIAEQALAKNAPQRLRSWRVVATIGNTRHTDATAMIATTAFVSVPVPRPYVGFAQTPVAHIVQPNPGFWSLRLAVEGMDQFGAWQREVSPTVPVEAKTNNFIYFSRVFTRITYFGYAESTPTSGTTISLGSRGDLEKRIDASNAHYATRNHGWGTPVRLRPNDGYQVILARGGPSMVAANDQLVGVSMVNQTESFETWVALPGALETGANVAGWPGTDHKVGLVDWSRIETVSGGSPSYVAGDSVIMEFIVRSSR